MSTRRSRRKDRLIAREHADSYAHRRARYYTWGLFVLSGPIVSVLYFGWNGLTGGSLLAVLVAGYFIRASGFFAGAARKPLAEARQEPSASSSDDAYAHALEERMRNGT